MGDWRKASEAQAAESGHLEHASWLGQRQLHPAHTRLVQPSVRTAGSKPAVLEVPGTRRVGARRKTLLRTLGIAKRVEPSEASAQNRAQPSRREGLGVACRKLWTNPLFSSPRSMKLTAAGCQRPARVPDTRNCGREPGGSPYPAQNRQRKNGLSDRRRVPRGDSDGRTAERCFQWATLAGLSSRIQA